MGQVFDLLKDNWQRASDAPIPLAIVAIAMLLLAYRLASWHQAGEVKNLKADKAVLEKQLSNRLLNPAPSISAGRTDSTAEVQSPDVSITAFYLNRQGVHWAPFNDSVSRRFWVAGTSLISVVERDLVGRFHAKGISDIKVILPNTQVDSLAYQQLHQFDLQPNADVFQNQVDAATDSFDRLSQRIARIFPRSERDHLRRYAGIMYANITIYDEDAIVSYYNSLGLGEIAQTIQFNSKTCPAGYKAVEDEFLRMWEADQAISVASSKGRGCSMIFVNSVGSVLMCLRDDKLTILHPGKWDLLGGRVMEGETPEECISRELHEEIEYVLQRPKLFRVFELPDRREYVFWKREDLPVPGTPLHEGQRLCWFTPDQIAKMSAEQIAFDFKPIVEQFLRMLPGLVHNRSTS